MKKKKKQLATRTVKWHLENLYRKGREDMLDDIRKLLSGKKAEKLSELQPGMNGEAWYYFLEENLT